MRTKHIAQCGLLAALAIVLSIIEKMFPLDALIPVPGVKLGLANVVTLFALYNLNVRDAVAVLVIRVSVTSLLLGSMTGFLFSFCGGLFALIVMWLLLRQEGKSVSLIGISVAGAAAHNIGQILIAVFWMSTTAVVAYLPWLLVLSVPLGMVTGLTAAVVLGHLRKVQP